MLKYSNFKVQEIEPITHDVVVSVKENPMPIENDALCDDLRAWMKSPAMGLQEYSSDPGVQRRVGRMLANFSAKFFASGAKTNSGQFYTDAHVDKP
jgi:hypothetical protein